MANDGSSSEPQALETYSSLVRSVNAWCEQHGARFSLLGRSPEGYWYASVLLPGGEPHRVQARTQHEVMIGFTRLGEYLARQRR